MAKASKKIEHRLVQPGTERWAELVKEGIIRDANRNWFLGDAALEIAPMGEGSANNGSDALLKAYADEVGVSPGSLRIYRDVAHAWPLPRRLGGTSWSVHHKLMHRQDLIKQGMTVTEAHQALGHSTAGRTGPRSDTKARIAQAKSLLNDPKIASDPEVIEASVQNPKVRSEAFRRHVDDHEQERRERAKNKPDTANFERKVSGTLSKFSMKLVEMLGDWKWVVARLREVNEGDIELPKDTYDKLKHAVQEAAQELKVYAIKHNMDEPSFERVDQPAE